MRGGALCAPSRHGEPPIAAARPLMPSRAIPIPGPGCRRDDLSPVLSVHACAQSLVA